VKKKESKGQTEGEKIAAILMIALTTMGKHNGKDHNVTTKW
jgi:hypothetical protein